MPQTLYIFMIESAPPDPPIEWELVAKQCTASSYFLSWALNVEIDSNFLKSQSFTSPSCPQVKNSFMFATRAIDITESSWALKQYVILFLSNILTILSSNAPSKMLGWVVSLLVDICPYASNVISLATLPLSMSKWTNEWLETYPATNLSWWRQMAVGISSSSFTILWSP